MIKGSFAKEQAEQVDRFLKLSDQEREFLGSLNYYLAARTNPSASSIDVLTAENDLIEALRKVK